MKPATITGVELASTSLLAEQLEHTNARCKKLAEALDDATAEYKHAKRRAEIDVRRAQDIAVEDIASVIVPIKDILETALAVHTADTDAFREGLALALRKLATELAKHGLVEFVPKIGDMYDPCWHHVGGESRHDCAGYRIVAVHRNGYLLNGRPLRPALVSV